MTIDFSLMISAESEAAAAARVVGVVVGVEELEAEAFRFGAFELTLLLPSVSKYGSLIVRPDSLNPASICPLSLLALLSRLGPDSSSEGLRGRLKTD